jgi:hypothetical protein
MRHSSSTARLFLTAAAGAAIACAVGAGMGRALTSSSSVSGGAAGAGSGAISGYTVSNVQYVLDQSSPQNIDEVDFSIAPASAGTVKVQLAGAWYTCTNSGGSVSCPTTSPQAHADAATGLTVVAVE